MNYKRVYTLLMNDRQQRIPKEDVYYEIHHIQPRSEGGSDHESNLVHLTPREHYMAHLLLWKASPRNMRRYWPLQWFFDKDGVRMPSRIVQMIKQDRSRFVGLRDYSWTQTDVHRVKMSLIGREAISKHDMGYRADTAYQINMAKKVAASYRKRTKTTKDQISGRFAAVTILVEDQSFSTLTEAALTFGISVKAAYNRVNSPNWPNWSRS